VMRNGLCAAIVIFLTAVLGGCGFSDSLRNEFSPYEIKSRLSEQDVAAASGEGTATIFGVVLVKKPDGTITQGEESFVYLIPVTPYTTEWYEQYLVQDRRISGRDPRSFVATRSAIVEAKGRFEFSDVPAGRYYLSCSITLDRPSYQFLRIRVPRAGMLNIKAYATVTVQEDEEVQVIVTRPSS